MGFSRWIDNRFPRFRRLIGHHLENAAPGAHERHEKRRLGGVAAASDHDEPDSRKTVAQIPL
jgi:hypothetical protein